MKNPQILDLYSDYCVSSFLSVTAVGLSELLNQGYSHDQISRFFSQRTFDQKDFWKFIKRLIRKIEHQEGAILIDDTISEKPYSTENEHICYHWDHSKGKSIKGIQMVNFAYHEPEQSITLPVSFELIKKTEEYYDQKTQKVKRRSPISKNEIVRQRLYTLTKQNKVLYKYVLWDSWYSSKENLAFVHQDLKKTFVAALQNNRTVALSFKDKKQGLFLKVSKLSFTNNLPLKVWLKGLGFPILLTKQVFKNKDGSGGELYLITNDLTMSQDQIFTIYQRRWNVEVFHKSLKQNTALSKSQTKYEVTQSNHIFASMIAYCKLEILKCKQHLNHFALKSRIYLKAIKAAFDEVQALKTKVPEIESYQKSMLELA